MERRGVYYFDPQPLIEATGGEVRGLARRLEIDPALLCRRLTANQADKYAVKLGRHPADIWGAAWWNVDLPAFYDEDDEDDVPLSSLTAPAA